MEEGTRARGSTLARIRWAAAWLLIVALFAIAVYSHMSGAAAGAPDLGRVPFATPKAALVSTAILMWTLVLLALRHKRKPFPSRLSAPLITDATYLEAFALYAGVFAFAPIGVAWMGASTWLVEVTRWSAPLWAVARLHVKRLPVSTMRRDSGLNPGAGWLAEVCVGIAALALLVLIESMWFGLLQAAAPPQTKELSRTFLDTYRIYRIAGALVYAPVVEEFCFRGLLFRHLRTSSGFWRSAAVTTLLFTAVHVQHSPQVLVGTAAMGFLACVIREWRGSLVGCITLHALGNGIALAWPWLS